MPKKQVIVKEAAVAAPPARAAKPKTTGVRAAKHSKAVTTETIVVQTDAGRSSPENSREAIAQIAYSYWEARGWGHGGALEDWVRAEHEYRNRTTSTRR